MPWTQLPPGPESPGQSWTAHPEAFADGPVYAESLDARPTKYVEDHHTLAEDSSTELCEFIRASARQEPRVCIRISGDSGRAYDFTIDLGPVLAQGGKLKRFTLKKEVWGWDLDLLRRTVQHRIWATGQRAYVDVEIECGQDDVVVEPENALVRLRHNPWVVAFAWVTLLYPLLWVLLHLFGQHGATYDQAVASYALKLYPALPGTRPGESVAEGAQRYAAAATRYGLPAEARLVRGPKGVHVLVGVEESEWLHQWEDRILQAVRMGIKAPLESHTFMLEVRDDEGPEMCEV
ncbi:hypothetical protein CspeluHIS016_0200660 [Cutaneotrichosporon spelunceum]|uniref:Uncharacterized protein n=1 Tax=Cutaneotrichosporon spelunceum TaxID=1672016 RepID=A0AAD3Y9I2_9TREE|nr:hypothetical protein CspeluHIS016_0200660 [Cutaneotrichosporon spelunceum]